MRQVGPVVRANEDGRSASWRGREILDQDVTVGEDAEQHELVPHAFRRRRSTSSIARHRGQLRDRHQRASSRGPSRSGPQPRQAVPVHRRLAIRAREPHSSSRAARAPRRPAESSRPAPLSRISAISRRMGRSPWRSRHARARRARSRHQLGDRSGSGAQVERLFERDRSSSSATSCNQKIAARSRHCRARMKRSTSSS